MVWQTDQKLDTSRRGKLKSGSEIVPVPDRLKHVYRTTTANSDYRRLQRKLWSPGKFMIENAVSLPVNWCSMPYCVNNATYTTGTLRQWQPDERAVP